MNSNIAGSEIKLPTRAKVVIIGGGVGGTSAAYHLTKYGEKDVVLLDRSDLTSGSTFHSAGLVGQLRADPTLTKMNMHSVELYRELEASQNPVGWREAGSIKLASSPERLEEIRRQIGWAKTFNLDLHEISPKEAQDLFPLMDLAGVVGASYIASDGQVDPSQLAYALASGARKNGGRIFTHTRVLSIKQEDGRVVGVETDKGFIECEVVLNCGGIFAAEIGRMVGIRIPIVPMSHQYMITENFLEPGQPLLPSLRDPDLLIYFRQEVSGLLMGGYERNSKAWSTTRDSLDSIPADFNAKLLPEEWDRFEEIAVNAQRRVPRMQTLGVKNFINGPEGFTPDNEFCLGETEVGGFYVAAGFCAHGIAGAGGIGKVIAEWIIGKEPPMDLWHMDIRRFGKPYEAPSFTLDRVTENYEEYYDIHYPLEERKTGRNEYSSPIFDWHKSHGAVFGEKAGWERVNYYSTNIGSEALRPFGWAGKNWSSAVQIEHEITRSAAGLFDESSFAKLEVSGEQAAQFLNLVCANDVVKGVGRTVYTQALNSKGGIESDYTITQMTEEKFLIVTGTAFGGHDGGWLRKKRRELGFKKLQIVDVTRSLAVFGIWGPKAREILQLATTADLSADGFKFMRSQEIEIAGVAVRATRITYVGELGWEIYLPVASGLLVWEELIRLGEPLGLRPCGYRAIESLRLEKGYRAWAGEINSETNPVEAGLGFALALGKEAFIGKEALPQASALKRKLVVFTFDDIRQVPLGNEPIRIDGQVVARVKSGGQGYSINKGIGYAYLPIEHCDAGTHIEVEFFGEWKAAQVQNEPLFDPESLRVRA